MWLDAPLRSNSVDLGSSHFNVARRSASLALASFIIRLNVNHGFVCKNRG